MEDKQIERLLEQNNELLKENNIFLHKIYKHIQWGRFFKAFYWVIIIGSAWGIFYFMQPFIDSIFQSYGGTMESLKGTPQ